MDELISPGNKFRHLSGSSLVNTLLTVKKILAVQGSPRGERSHSRRLVELFVDALVAEHKEVEILRREVGRAHIPHVNEAWVAAAFHPEAEKMTASMRVDLALSEELIEELFDVDALVIGAPMYNFGIPSGLKAWVDQIVRIRRTFDFTPEDAGAQYKPRVHGKHALIVTTRGDAGYGPSGPNAALNHADTYLRDVLRFIGIHDVRVVAVENDEFGGDAFAESYRAAERTLRALASDF